MYSHDQTFFALQAFHPHWKPQSLISIVVIMPIRPKDSSVSFVSNKSKFISHIIWFHPHSTFLRPCFLCWRSVKIEDASEKSVQIQQKSGRPPPARSDPAQVTGDSDIALFTPDNIHRVCSRAQDSSQKSQVGGNYISRYHLLSSNKRSINMIIECFKF